MGSAELPNEQRKVNREVFFRQTSVFRQFRNSGIGVKIRSLKLPKVVEKVTKVELKEATRVAQKVVKKEVQKVVQKERLKKKVVDQVKSMFVIFCVKNNPNVWKH